MKKEQVQTAMTQIESNLKNTYTKQGKKFSNIPSSLPYKLLKKLARAKIKESESYTPGTIGKSSVATILSRKERREGVVFVPKYNGDLYKIVRTGKFDEKKKKNVTVESYELIKGWWIWVKLIH